MFIKLIIKHTTKNIAAIIYEKTPVQKIGEFFSRK
jgi:hypothetical protein